MDSQTILRPTAVDLKKLPLGAREAFVLSQIDGRLTLEEVAEIAGLEMREATKVGEVLVELGAASKVRVDPRAEAGSGRPGGYSDRKSVDPRAEKSVRAAPSISTKKSFRHDPRAEQASVPPPPARPPETSRPVRKPSRKSIGKITAVSEACDLDVVTLAVLEELDTRLEQARDHYSVLEIDRDADKKTVKRAYFAFASKYHPDRFFGKKLGKARVQIDRIFRRMTAAHDTLTDAAARSSYDATLPAAPKQKTVSPPKPKTITPGRPSRKMSKAAMKAAAREVEPSKQPEAPRIDIEEKRNNLREAAIEIKTQERVEMFVKAAEEALAKNDVITAANNYRLALEHREDRRLRMIFEDVEERARTARFEKQIGPAKAAERDGRWNDAALLLTKAHALKPSADIASRAAHAILLANGDAAQAIVLGEEAVGLEPKVVTHRITLAEAYLVANKIDRAEEHAEVAHEIAPKDERVRALFALIVKKSKR